MSACLYTAYWMHVHVNTHAYISKFHELHWAPCKARRNQQYIARLHYMVCSGALQGAQKELVTIASVHTYIYMAVSRLLCDSNCLVVTVAFICISLYKPDSYDQTPQHKAMSWNIIETAICVCVCLWSSPDSAPWSRVAVNALHLHMKAHMCLSKSVH